MSFFNLSSICFNFEKIVLSFLELKCEFENKKADSIESFAYIYLGNVEIPVNGIRSFRYLRIFVALLDF